MLDKETLTEPMIRRDDKGMTLPTAMVLRAGPVSEYAGRCGPDVMELDVTPYGVSLRVPSHLPIGITLPHGVAVDLVEASYDPHERVMEVRVPVNPTSYAAGPDPGSRPWLLSHALEGSDQERGLNDSASDGASGATAGGEVTAPEDRYHLNSKPGKIDPFTGLPSRQEEPVDEDEELPEDRFHRDDPMSNHYIQQREGDRAEKHKRHAEEKAERDAKKEKDPNVEYIDTEDFEPGGKYGPPAIDVAARRDELAGVSYTTTDDMRKAAELVATKAKEAAGGPANGGGDGGGGSGGGGGGTSPALGQLKSTVWAELLD